MSYAAAEAVPAQQIESALTPVFLPHVLRSASEPNHRYQIIFRQKVFSPDSGKTTIHFYEDPILWVDSRDFSIELQDWEVKMPLAEVADLPRQICRRFLLLWGKAERKVLEDAESETWLKILDSVDFVEFSAQRAGPRVYEGTLIRKVPFYFVEWSDGERVRLPDDVATPLNLLEPGELFTVDVRLGREEEIVSMENVTPLGDESSLLTGVFDEWPEPA